jgi:HEAT repeat protein
LSRTVVSILTGALKNRDPAIREVAALTLGGLGPAARDSVSALRETLANDDAPSVRAAAEEALRRIVLTGSNRRPKT